MRRCEENSETKFVGYKIVVATDEDRQELMEAFEHIHDSDVDTDYTIVNQLSHEYLDETRGVDYSNNIIVDAELLSKLQA